MSTNGSTHLDFYVVTATVIPVLLVTTALQTSFWQRYAIGAVPRSMRNRDKMIVLGRRFTAAVAVAVVVVALIGEWTSVQALRHLSDGPGKRSWASDGLGLLLLANIGGLSIRLVSEIMRGHENPGRTQEEDEET